MTVRRFLIAPMALMSVLAFGAPTAGAGSPTAGFENPESSYWDAASSSWYVSNLGGFGLDLTSKDGNGFISRLDADGVVVERQWVTGLNSPKGVRGHDGKIYVSDIDTVVVIDAASGQVEDRVAIPGAEFLNDLDVDPHTGDVWVTDSWASALYRLPGGSGPAVTFLSGEKLESPNGVLVDGDSIILGTIGPGFDRSTFQSDEPGRLLRVNIGTGAITAVSPRIGNVDGIEKDGDGFLVSSFFEGEVLRVGSDGSASPVLQSAPTSADFGFDPQRRLIGLPHLGLNVVLFFEV